MDSIPGAINHARTSLAISIIQTLGRRFNVKAQIFCSQMSGVREIIEDVKSKEDMGVTVFDEEKNMDTIKLKGVLLDIDRCKWVSGSAESPSILVFCKSLSAAEDASNRLNAKIDESVEKASIGFGKGLETRNSREVAKNVEMELDNVRRGFSRWWYEWFKLYESQGKMSFFEERLDCVSMAEKMQQEIRAFRNNWVYFAKLFGGEGFNDDPDFRNSDGTLIGEEVDHGVNDAVNDRRDDVIDRQQMQRVRAVLDRDGELKDKLKGVRDQIRELEIKVKQDEPVLQQKESELQQINKEIEELEKKKKNLNENVNELAVEVDQDQQRLENLNEQHHIWSEEMQKIKEEEEDAAADTVTHVIKREVKNLVQGKGTAVSKKEGDKVKGAVGWHSSRQKGSVYPEASSSMGSMEEMDSQSEDDELINDRFGQVQDRHWEYRNGEVRDEVHALEERMAGMKLGDGKGRPNPTVEEAGAAVDLVKVINNKRVLTTEGLRKLGIRHINGMIQNDTSNKSVKTSIILRPETISGKPEKTQNLYRRHDVYYMLYSMLKSKILLTGLSTEWYEHLKHIHRELSMTERVPANKPSHVNESMWKFYSQLFSPVDGGKKHPIVAAIENFRQNNSPEMIHCINLALENVMVGLLLNTMEQETEITEKEKNEITKWHENALDARKKLSDHLEMPPTPRSVESSAQTPEKKSSTARKRIDFQSPTTPRNRAAAFNTYSYPYLSSPLAYLQQQDTCSCMRCGLKIFRP